MQPGEIRCDEKVRLAIALRLGRDIANPSRFYAAGETGRREVRNEEDVAFLMSECGMLTVDFGRKLMLPSAVRSFGGTEHYSAAALHSHGTAQHIFDRLA